MVHTLLNADILTVALSFLCSQWGEVVNLPNHLQMSVLGKKQSQHQKKLTVSLHFSVRREPGACRGIHCTQLNVSEMNLGKCMTIMVRIWWNSQS